MAMLLLLRVVGGIALLMMLATACAPTERPSIDSIVAPYLGPDLGGVAVGVVRDGKVVVSQGFGAADRERDIAVTSDTVFDLASLSKQFTGMALLMLAERGQLSIEDDVRNYVPELPLFDPQRPIRIVDLSRHRSGLPEFPRAANEIPTEREILAWLATLTKLEFPTDTQRDYTNLNYFILARVVERASGRTLRTFLEGEVFGPAGMTSAQVLDRPDGEIRNRAVGYCFGKPCRADDGLTGPGGVFASLKDMISWDRALRRGTFVSFGAITNAAETGYGVGWRMTRRGGHVLAEGNLAIFHRRSPIAK